MPRKAGATAPPSGHSEMESLEAMLEPERTGVHKSDKKAPWVLIIVMILVLVAGAAAGVFYMLLV